MHWPNYISVPRIRFFAYSCLVIACTIETNLSLENIFSRLYANPEPLTNMQRASSRMRLNTFPEQLFTRLTGRRRAAPGVFESRRRIAESLFSCRSPSGGEFLFMRYARECASATTRIGVSGIGARENRTTDVARIPCHDAFDFPSGEFGSQNSRHWIRRIV